MTKKRTKSVWHVGLAILGLALLYWGAKLAYDLIIFARGIARENMKLVIRLEIQNTRTNLVQFKPSCPYIVFNGGDTNLKFFSESEQHFSLLTMDNTNTVPHTNVYQLKPHEHCLYKARFPDSHRSLVWVNTASLRFRIVDRKGSNLTEMVMPFEKRLFKKGKHVVQF